MMIRKSIMNESATDTLQGPSIGPEAGLSSLLIEAINSEWETVDKYNSMAITARNEGFEEIAYVLDEINTEENKHIGQLQELLKTISPNATAIDDGEDEAEDYIDDDISWYKD